MGEVYRGRDIKLNRDVAIKVLLPAVAADAERLARFNREAQVLASLNHPNIAHIHGIADGESGPLLILEFVDGPTLADRIARGPLPVDEAIAIAKQIADALEAAHERGIIHRDLKPANIKVDDHGNVKVLDFGLAKAIDPNAADSSSSANSPTITSPAMTQAGLILGTAAYMSPEQAKGRAVDKRSDVWAFGCVLYEMLTGARAFGGEDVTDTIAAVVRGEPDWTKLPASTPPQVRLLLKRCLEKDRKARISDIGVARFLLNETIEAPPAAAAASSPGRGPLAAIAVLLLGAILGAGAWALSTSTPAAPSSSSIRFEIPTRDRPLLLENGRTIAIAPDGSFIVYRAAYSEQGRETSVLMMRKFDELEPRMLPETFGARTPFISPDGRWIGFFGPQHLRKIPVTGGPSEDICRFVGAPRGASWGDDGYIVFAVSQTEGLQRVPATGGEPATLTTPEQQKRHQHTWPTVLPGGKSVAYSMFDVGAGTVRIDLVEVATKATKTLLTNGYGPVYARSGHLIFGTITPLSRTQLRASLRAVRFDPDRGEIIGETVTMIDPIGATTESAISFDVSKTGDLVYVVGEATLPTSQRSLVWLDRSGRETPIEAPLRNYMTARISPDGTRLALDVRDHESDVMVWDLARKTLTALSPSPGIDSSPIWTPDGRRIVWASSREGLTNPNIFWQAADGSGTAVMLGRGERANFPTSVTPDGRMVVMFGTAGGSGDIYALSTIDGARQVLLGTEAMEIGGEVSPDGKWLAYHSGESGGERQVYVRPFPNVQAGRWQISTKGGSRAAWAPSGRELFYQDERGFLESVPVSTAGTTFSAGSPKTIVDRAYVSGRTTIGLDLRSYDVAPDGQRFLMIKDPEKTNAAADVRLVTVLNWAQELKARLP